jgi:hypothetical protein
MAKEVKLRQGWADPEDIGLSPDDATYVTSSASDGLSAERVATDTATIDVDAGTADQLKWNLIVPVTVASGGTGQTTEAEAIGELTQALTEDTSPDRIADFVGTYDASDDTGKKVALWRTTGQAVLATGSVANATALDLPLDVTGYSNFNIFKLYIRDLLSETDSDDLLVRFSDDGGSTFEADASDYSWCFQMTDEAGVHDSFGDDADSEIAAMVGLGNGALEHAHAEITIYSAATTNRTHITCLGTLVDIVPDQVCAIVSGCLVAGVAVTDIRLLMSSGGQFAASYTLIGIV